MRFDAQAALLLALGGGPGFGLDLIARVESNSGGQLRLSRGGAYLAMRALERRGLVRGWLNPAVGVCRPRRYYELTDAGIVERERVRRGLRNLCEPALPLLAVEAAEMARLFERGRKLNAFAFKLRAAGRDAGL